MATLAALLAQLRIDLDDVAEPRLWSDGELLNYINRAVDEACLRARLIRDSDTPEVCEIRLRPGVSRYELHKSILGVRRARISGHDAMDPMTAEVMDEERPRWEDESAERPIYYITNLDDCWIRMVPTPTIINTVNLTVWRKPINELTLERQEEEPKIPAIHHWNMLEWVKHLAYAKHDAEAHDPQASALCMQMFAQFFGDRRSAEVTEILRTTPRIKVKAHFR